MASRNPSRREWASRVRVLDIDNDDIATRRLHHYVIDGLREEIRKFEGEPKGKDTTKAQIRTRCQYLLSSLVQQGMLENFNVEITDSQEDLGAISIRLSFQSVHGRPHEAIIKSFKYKLKDIDLSEFEPEIIVTRFRELIVDES
jgi:hypothetical protein